MEKLKPIINKRGFVYHLVCRTDGKALYTRWYEGKVIGHELFKIKILPESEFNGITFHEREKFPSDNDFGVTAWSVGRSIDIALQKYNKLIL